MAQKRCSKTLLGLGLAGCLSLASCGQSVGLVDSLLSLATCGDNNIESEYGETCDPPGSCPTACDDNNQCTLDVLVGEKETCSAYCEHEIIPNCCGNEIVEADASELCDPPASCPTTCPSSGCSIGSLVGSAANCDAECVYNDIVNCVDQDDCCPQDCDYLSDSDCWSDEESPFGEGTQMNYQIASLCLKEKYDEEIT